MIDHALKAVGQLADPRTRKVLWKSMAVTAALLALVLWLAWLALDGLAPFEIPLLDGLVGLAGVLAASFIAMLVFPATVCVVAGLFLDQVAAACEARHYPNLPPPRRQGAGETAIGAARFAFRMIALNLVFTPVYLLALLVPPLAMALFYGVNGHLMGGEYFAMVAARRLEPDRVAALRRRHRPRLMLYGAALLFLHTVPILNMVAPVLATAFMVHVAEALRREPEGQ